MNPARTAREILEYLTRYPDAEDTVEGILEWWLLERQIHRGLAEVETALGKLVAAGLIQERRGTDGRTHYRLKGRQQEPSGPRSQAKNLKKSRN